MCVQWHYVVTLFEEMSSSFHFLLQYLERFCFSLQLEHHWLEKYAWFHIYSWVPHFCTQLDSLLNWLLDLHWRVVMQKVWMNLYTFLKIEMFLNIFFSFVETLESVTFTLCTSILLSNKKQPSKAKKSLVFIVNHIAMHLLSFVIYVPMGILLRTHFYEEHYFDSDLHNASGQF